MREHDKALLLNLYLFEQLSGPKKEEALASLPIGIADFPSGSIILSKEKFTSALNLVLSGTVCVYRASEGKDVLLNTLKAGDTFGAAAMFGASDTYPTTVKAKGPVRVATIAEQDLENLFLQYPDTSISHIRFLSDRVRFLNEKIHSLTGRSVESKLSNFILEADGKDALHHLNMSRLASSLDIGRASLYRLIQKFCEQNLITFEDGTITIINLKQLERLAKS